jgi:hypothetical protein
VTPTRLFEFFSKNREIGSGAYGRGTANKMWVVAKFFLPSGIFPLKNKKSLARAKNYIKNSVGCVLNLLLPRSLGLPSLVSPPVDVCILVLSGQFATFARCLLYPQSGHQLSVSGCPLCAISGLLHRNKELLFQHLVGNSEERRRHIQSERLGCFEVDDIGECFESALNIVFTARSDDVHLLFQGFGRY